MGTGVLTYLGFHAVFVLPPLLLLAGSLPALPPDRRRRARIGLAVMVVAAVTYTAPWDAHLIREAVWSYGDGRVLARIGPIPAGEYLFFVFQTVLTGLWLHVSGFDPTTRSGDWERRPRATGVVCWLAVAVVGLLLLGTRRGYYLGAILAWAAPLFALQWGVGGAYLARTWRSWSVAVAVPTAYLWFADRLAIGLCVWTIAPTHTT